MAFAEDLDVYFDTTDGFADTVKITLNDSSEIEIPGIFDNPSEAFDIYNVAIETVMPVVRVKTSDIANVRTGNTLERNSVIYTIEKIETGGTGISFLHLGK